VQIIQRQLDKLSAPCTFGTGAYRDIFPRLELFSSYYIHYSSTWRTIHQRRSSPFSSAHQVTSIGLHESGTISKHKQLYRSKRQDYSLHGFSFESSFATQELDSRVPRLQQTAVDQVCSSSDKQELPSISTASTATAVDQVCSSSDKQETSLSGTASTATPVDPVCSSRDTRISKLQTLSFVWQIKPTIPTTLLFHQSLQLHPSCLQFASNSNTLPNLWHLWPYSQT